MRFLVLVFKMFFTNYMNCVAGSKYCNLMTPMKLINVKNKKLKIKHHSICDDVFIRKRSL